MAEYQTSSGLNNEQWAKLCKAYPSWPWVTIGRTNEEWEQMTDPPKPTSDEELKALVDKGRCQMEVLLESDIEDMDRFMISDMGFGEDLTGHRHQRDLSVLETAFRDWDEADLSAGIDNRARVRFRGGKIISDDNRIVERRYDPILSVLESLRVGHPIDNPENEYYKVKWEEPRTVSPIVYPHGPNILIGMRRDGSDLKEKISHGDLHSWNGIHINFYNIFDGAILASNTEAAHPHLYKKHSAMAEWCDTTWVQWNRLHSSPALGEKFPPEGIAEKDRLLFHLDLVSGRVASKARAKLEFYESLSHEERASMRCFLNWVIFYGASVRDEDAAVVQRCLRSRNSEMGNGGKVPLFGSQETFQVGHWAFYALLGTYSGQQLTRLLANDKDPEGLGHKMLKSVTVFAVDSLRLTVTTDASGEEEILKEMSYKWPVLIWEVVDCDEILIAQARQIEQDYVNDDTGIHKKANMGYAWKFPNIDCPQIAQDALPVMPNIALPKSVDLELDNWPGNTVFKQH